MIENDLYKFSMSHYYQVNYPNAWGTFAFHDRNNTEYTEEFVDLLKKEFKELDKLFLEQAEFKWCVENIPYIPQYYWEWLQGFRYNSYNINVWLDDEKHLHIEVSDLMYRVTFYEIPILAIVSELYHMYIGDNYQSFHTVREAMMDGMIEKTKIAENHNLFFADFGLRRRFSGFSEDAVAIFMKDHCKTFVGTSNVYLAKVLRIKPIGTQAHECFMFQAAIHSPKEANYEVMENWVKVYDGALGTVLTDTYTVDTFLRNFSMKLAKLYDGVRHDSGDPFDFIDKIIDKYQSYGIDPMSKTIVFSDGLDFPTAVKIKEYCVGKIKASFGIGTNLTCDIPGVKPMNIVMKLKECRINMRQPIYGCVKLSDVPTKAIGSKEDIENYKYQLGIKEA
jgi:nicotinate phosphoribosyltransferase